VQHLGALERVLKAKVELLECLVSGEAAGLDPGPAAVAVAAVDLGLEQDGGELLIDPFVLAATVGELGQRACGCWCLERAEEVREL
jgi:hypothetical protein